MTSLLILAPKVKSKSTEMLIDEAKKIFEKVDFVPIRRTVIEVSDGIEINYEGKSIMDYDYVLPRIDSIRASYGYHLIKAFDLCGIKKPYPAETILIAHNKFATIFELGKAGIPVPKSVYTSAKESADFAIKMLNFPNVIKLVSSFGGKGVLFAESEEAAKSVVKTLDVLKQDLLLEEFVPNKGEDLRAFVVGKQVVASMKRVAKKGEKRANISIGGKGTQVSLTHEEEQISIKAAEIIKADICAVDLLRGPNGPIVIETNINPGLQGITKATGDNVAQKIIQFCHSEAKK